MDLAIRLPRALAASLTALVLQGVTAEGVRADVSVDPVIVTATRIAQSSDILPVSAGRIDRDQIERSGLGVNLSEVLNSLPGVSAQNRQNYAQDLQISVRGFGARSSFGVRGVRLYADGIPGTMPDGQGQFSNFDLSSAARIEVLRGPFSALYGNSSGGVISIFTQDGVPGFEAVVRAEGGSFRTQRYSAQVDGQSGPVNYVVDLSHFHTDGYRDHSAADRDIGNAKVRIDLGAGSKLTLVANYVQTPDNLDPLGLTRAQLDVDPTQAGTNALAYNTRKSLDQGQFGAILDQRLGAYDSVQTTAYIGHRNATQYQGILRTAEGSPTHPGGVIDLSRTYFGMDTHVTDDRSFAGMRLQTTIGVSYDALDEDRLGFLNFVGTTLGVEGAKRRDEYNQTHNIDEYLQTQWDLSDRWRALGGVRHNDVELTSRNHLAAAGIAPVSKVSYQSTNPVFGLVFRATRQLHAYASFGQGFETPTFNDLAYRSVNGSLPGLNLGLQPARSNNYEIGVKFSAERVRATLAAFDIKAKNELAVQANSGGRSVFENIPRSERRGLEFALDGGLGAGFDMQLAYTYLRALITDSYNSCSGIPCVPRVIPAGNRIPAVPANVFSGTLNWRYQPAGFIATLEATGRSQIFVDDANSDAAAGFWSFNARVGLEQRTSRLRLSEFFRVDNIANRHYADSVIVNESNSRFFEPDPGRTAYAGFTVAWAALK